MAKPLSWIVVAAVAASAGAGLSTSIAAPLDAEACARLKTEKAGLATAEADLAKGVTWAKANLTPARLADIARFVALEEQYLFRCPQPRRSIVAEEEDGEAKAAPAKATPKKGAATKNAKASAGARIAKDATGPEAETEAEPKAKPKPRPKPPAKAVKANQPPVDDSYKPPGAQP